MDCFATMFVDHAASEIAHGIVSPAVTFAMQEAISSLQKRWKKKVQTQQAGSSQKNDWLMYGTWFNDQRKFG